MFARRSLRIPDETFQNPPKMAKFVFDKLYQW